MSINHLIVQSDASDPNPLFDLAVKSVKAKYMNVTDGFEINGVVVLSDAGTRNIFVGPGSAPGSGSTGVDDTSLGYHAGSSTTTAAENTLLGSQAGAAVTTGGQNTMVGYESGTLMTTGVSNTAVGCNSLSSSLAGNYNVALGCLSAGSVTTGSNNTCLGVSSGHSLTTGSNNICIGYSSDVKAASDTNEVVIGYNTVGNGSNTTTLANDVYIQNPIRILPSTGAVIGGLVVQGTFPTASGATPVTLNTRIGACTFTSVNIGATNGGFVNIANSLAGVGTQLVMTISSQTVASSSLVVLYSYVCTSGNIQIGLYNPTSVPTGASGSITVTFMLLN